MPCDYYGLHESSCEFETRVQILTRNSSYRASSFSSCRSNHKELVDKQKMALCALNPCSPTSVCFLQPFFSLSWFLWNISATWFSYFWNCISSTLANINSQFWPITIFYLPRPITIYPFNKYFSKYCLNPNHLSITPTPADLGWNYSVLYSCSFSHTALKAVKMCD